jgi:hypothetical protein
VVELAARDKHIDKRVFALLSVELERALWKLCQTGPAPRNNILQLSVEIHLVAILIFFGMEKISSRKKVWIFFLFLCVDYFLFAAGIFLDLQKARIIFKVFFFLMEKEDEQKL